MEQVQNGVQERSNPSSKENGNQETPAAVLERVPRFLVGKPIHDYDATGDDVSEPNSFLCHPYCTHEQWMTYCEGAILSLTHSLHRYSICNRWLCSAGSV